jgi:hypothetical protein
VGTNYSILLEGIFVLTKFVTIIRPNLGNGSEVSLKGKTQYSSTPCANCLVLWSIVCTFLIENDAEILPVYFTWKVAFTNLIHKQSIQVKW